MVVELDEATDDLVLLFEADARLRNPSGGREWMAYRHGSVGHIATCNGAARACSPPVAAALRWKP